VKEQCLWLHNFESLDEARQTLRAWFKLQRTAASPSVGHEITQYDLSTATSGLSVQFSLGHYTDQI